MNATKFHSPPRLPKFTYTIIIIFIAGCIQQFPVSTTTITGGVEAYPQNDNNRSFTIDYEQNRFLKDGKPFRYVSGSIHYFRLVEDYWDDILRKMRLGGLNAIETYVEWSSHQPKPTADFNFNGNLNITKFLKAAQDNDLPVIFRPGPYIDAERDMGGLPPWLLWEYPGIKLRTVDPDFKNAVAQWFNILLPMIKPYLYENGGPIIMIQVENEYGSSGCDTEYKIWFRDLIISHVGPNVVLFTNDNAREQNLRCGSIQGVIPTLDFGTDIEDIDGAFAVLRQFWPKGPLINSEFYPGWFDYWGKPHSKVNTSNVATQLDRLLAKAANVNIYMYYGGTSFGFGSGATIPNNFYANPTSYDYDAPLSEAGDPTEKYFAIKKIISKYLSVPGENSTSSPKANYGKLIVDPMVSILDPAILHLLAPGQIQSLVPQTFEQLHVSTGFVLYETVINNLVSDPSQLDIPELRDRAYVFVDQDLVGILSRTDNIFSVPIFIEKGQKLQILVESQGRPSWGTIIGETKGIGNKVQLGSHILGDWTIYPLGQLTHNNEFMNFINSRLNYSNSSSNEFAKPRKAGMTFIARFTVGTKAQPNPIDTFIRLDTWRKGMIWINGFNLGRYWPVQGPQQTLYLPAPLLKPFPQLNQILLLELESVSEECFNTLNSSPYAGKDNCFVQFVDEHVIDGPTPDE